MAADLREMVKKFVDLEEELRQYKQFALGRNMASVAIALILANACQKVVTAISENILMPIINFFTSSAGERWRDMEVAITPGLYIEIGKFLSASLEFAITTIVLYVIFFKVIKVIDPDAEVK